MSARILTFVVWALALVASTGIAEEWSRARIERLPDSAFAAIETARDGRQVRHLPHHDETGALDVAHVNAARARLGQVKWIDPRNEALAREHLEEHVRSLNAPSEPLRHLGGPDIPPQRSERHGSAGAAQLTPAQFTASSVDRRILRRSEGSNTAGVR